MVHQGQRLLEGKFLKSTNSNLLKGIENNYNGVLGGLNHISGLDILDSKNHIEKLIAKHNLGTARCLDCGSGVGRITKELHSQIFDKIDLLEPDQGFMDQARVRIPCNLSNII